MNWYKDEWEDAYDELIYDDDEECEDEAAYFDVPLPYRPIEIRTVRFIYTNT